MPSISKADAAMAREKIKTTAAAMKNLSKDFILRKFLANNSRVSLETFLKKTINRCCLKSSNISKLRLFVEKANWSRPHSLSPPLQRSQSCLRLNRATRKPGLDLNSVSVAVVI